ncbi:cytidylyltransferase domain-containing protein [Polynucleobacter necessarius]|uniref:acylneuraminate cytidylyltransferase family protein n=1 Tax=Polynucleobacter necessarius TaxID=576610 RepID=UPI0013B0552B|nr:acylneuraminate cytidylyltransferase family protein [Polynucleobacter necessarius]
MVKIVVVIPARSGSKSLPNKNILPLHGKPLLCYSVAYALGCKAVDKIVVSTDSEHIASIAKECGAETPFLRPGEYSQDSTRDYPVMKHALEFFEDIDEIYDIYVLLRPTSPIRPSGLIERTIKILEKNPSASSVRSVAKIKEHPYRAWYKENDGSMRGFVEDVHEAYNIPRQELPDVYFQTGDIEAIRRVTLLDGSISGSNVYPLIIKHDEMVDIDHINDFKNAEEKLKS